MAVNWKRLAEQHQMYTESDFQKVAMRLITEQILYQSNPMQRTAYDLVAKFENEFAEVLELIGCRLDVNPQARYVATVPLLPETSKVPLMHTLLALVLRKLYDHHIHRGTLQAGVAGVGLPELETAFSESTGRELPMKPHSELLNIMDAMKRWGIARAVKSEGAEESTWVIEILPGIQSLINERTIAMLKAHAETLYMPESSQSSITEGVNE